MTIKLVQKSTTSNGRNKISIWGTRLSALLVWLLAGKKHGTVSKHNFFAFGKGYLMLRVRLGRTYC